MSHTDPITPPPQPGVNSGAREGYAVPAYYMIPAVLLIYTVKSGKSLTFLLHKINKHHLHNYLFNSHD